VGNVTVGGCTDNRVADSVVSHTFQACMVK